MNVVKHISNVLKKSNERGTIIYLNMRDMGCVSFHGIELKLKINNRLRNLYYLFQKFSGHQSIVRNI